MKVYVSTLNFGSGPLSQMLSELDGSGYSAIEISSGHSDKEDPEESKKATLRYHREQNAAVILHNYAPPEPGGLLINLSDPDPDQRERVVRFLKARIDLTKELGSDYYSFHGGYRVPYRFGVRQYTSNDRLSRDHALETFLSGLKEVLAHAEAQEVHIGIENHVVIPGNAENVILYDQADFETVLGEAASPYLHLHLDVGHLKVTSQTLQFDPLAFIKTFQDKIMTVHLHDNDGSDDEHLPFLEKAWFLDQLTGLSNLQYACLETQTGGDKQRIGQMLDLLKDL